MKSLKPIFLSFTTLVLCGIFIVGFNFLIFLYSSSPSNSPIYLKGIIEQEKIQKVIIGYPKNMDGSSGDTARKVEDFVSNIKRQINIPIETWDERLSSVSAEKLLIQGEVKRRKRKKVIDQLSAVIILQNYLDYQNLPII